MVINKPLIRGSIALNCHPTGVKESIKKQVEYVKSQGVFQGPKKALIIGGSSGFGLASAISLVFGAQTDIISVSFESGPTGKRVGSAGWFSNIYLKQMAEKEGRCVKNIIGDAFSDEIKQQVIDAIKSDFGGTIDLIVYSLASPKRTDPKTGITYVSSIKSMVGNVHAPTVNIETQSIEDVVMEKATDQEVADTIKVMGGEDWLLWIQALDEAGVLAHGVKTFAESYYGSEATYMIYKDGTLGASKRDLEQTTDKLNTLLKDKYQGEALICVSKAVTTKASAYIPLFPLYAAALYKVMKQQGSHEIPIQHKYRFIKEMLYGRAREVDTEGRLRPDSWEMKPEVQSAVQKIMKELTPDNFKELTDFEGFYQDFLQLNGFGFKNVDYEADVDVDALQKLEP